MGCGGVLVVCLASCEGLGSDSEGDSSVALFKSPFPRKNNAEVAFESRRALKKDNNKLLQMLQMRYWIFSVGFACVRYLEGICSATKN